MFKVVENSKYGFHIRDNERGIFIYTDGRENERIGYMLKGSKTTAYFPLHRVNEKHYSVHIGGGSWKQMDGQELEFKITSEEKLEIKKEIEQAFKAMGAFVKVYL